MTIRSYRIDNQYLANLKAEVGDRIELFKVPFGSKFMGVDSSHEGETWLIFEDGDSDFQATISLDLGSEDLL